MRAARPRGARRRAGENGGVTIPSPAWGGPANLADVLRAAAAAAANRPALTGAHGSRSWAELDAAVDAGVTALAAGGYRRGERAVLALPTGIELAAALFAVLRAGLVAVPVRPGRTDLGWVARRVGATVACTDEPASGAVRVISSAELGGWWGAGSEPAGRSAGDADPPGAGGEDLALLARAARSGPPVMLSHRALLAAAAAVFGAPHLDLTPDDRVLQVLPLYHVVGLVTAFLPAALAGASVVLPDPATPGTRVEAALRAVSDHRVTVLPAEPTLYRQMHRADGFERALATVRLMTSGSSPLDPAESAAIRAATGQSVREGYGISESAAAIASTLMTTTARPGSVGVPYPGVQLRIVGDAAEPPSETSRAADEPGQGVAGAFAPAPEPPLPGPRAGAAGRAEAPAWQATPDIPDGPVAPGLTHVPDIPAEPAGTGSAEPEAPAEAAVPDPLPDDGRFADFSDGDDVLGPIAIRGSTLFSGYWPDGAGGPDEDGWYVTGDIGYLDDAGELRLVDRAAETVTVAGFTVYPREVEDVLVTHPGVADAAVVGVPGPAGEAVVAALVVKPGAGPTPDELAEFLADKLAPFKIPTDYQLVDVLPRTEVGRLDREAVRRSCAGPSAVPTRVPGTTGAAADPVAMPPLEELGSKLPHGNAGRRRGAQDTDEDLF